MQFRKLVREDTQIQTIYDKPNADGHIESFDITAHEAPHPGMDKALEALASVCQDIKELASVATIKPYGITISYTKHGTRSCSILFTRKLEATGGTYKDKTPSFQIDNPADGEDDERECNTEQTDLLIEVIEEGERYAAGERQQTLLPLDETDPQAEPKDGKSTEPLNLGDGEEE